MDGLSIGQLASAAGVGVETVRYYQREGLMHEPPKPPGAIRRYGDPALQRLRFIGRAKELGFTLAQVGELLQLRDDPDATTGDVRELTAAKIEDLQARITDLQRMQAALEAMLASCTCDGPTAQCAILEAIAEPAR
jgi:MerR family copper efflux transcriptional regulator